ncbi:MAG: hypothetical protein ACLFSA_01640 [Spirochaetaceae bacterium]
MKKHKETEGVQRVDWIRGAIIGAVVIGILLSGCGVVQGLGKHVEDEIASSSYGGALKKEDKDERFTALLEAFDNAVSSGRTGRFGRTDPSGRVYFSGRVYLGHLYYMEEKHGAAEVYLLDEGDGEYSEKLEPLAYLLLLFHRGRQAFTEGDYQKAVFKLEDGFFSLLDSPVFNNSDLREGGVIYSAVSEASDLLAASFSALDRPRGALEVYRRLWKRRSVEMREDRFISYALLLSESIEDTKRKAGKSEKEELRLILEEWSSKRPFSNQGAPVFMELYGRMNQPAHQLLAGAEQLEYIRPSFGRQEFVDAVEGLVSSASEGTAVYKVAQLLRRYSREEWGKMEETLANLREAGDVEGLLRHRYFKYLSAAADMYLGREGGTFEELEELFSEFQMYYLNLAGGALAAEPGREKLAAAALKAGILAAPGTERALEARYLLWDLEGASGGAASKPYPLLDEELTQIAEFIRLGASPVLLDPAVNLLRYSDNIFSLKAELALRQIRGLSRVENYLALRYEEAEGRLRERLGSILRR